MLNHYKNANEKPQYYPRQPQTFHRHSHEPTSRYYHESGNLGLRVKKTYIPSFPQKQKTKIRNLKSRHSHESGNLGLSVRKLIG
ncbi:PilS cassette [Neisseria meningitidis serogroup B]|uniref:PilS cassette n=1 Tax=Neisseria meningitidis serogroup B TaxID=491 RepID=A0A0H5Q9V0_NEIMI|nr:PilS cassette [Neisseria meningitidis serogroup B]